MNADANAEDRTYLVLGKPNVIMNASESEGWRSQEVTLRVGRVLTTKLRPLATSNAPSGMRLLVLG